MESKEIGNRKRRFKPFDSLRSWWKRRKFQYLVHVNIPEERIVEHCRMKTEIPDKIGIEATESFVVPLALHLDERISTDVNSIHNSIESMDSVIDSFPTRSNEEDSESMEVLDEFLMEHLSFLSQSTQPQEVQIYFP